MDLAAAVARHAEHLVHERGYSPNTVDAYGGDLAAGQTWPWLPAARETVRNQVVDAYLDLTEHLEPARALPILRHAITVDPFNEALHRRCVHALTEAGDHPAAQRLRAAYLDNLAQAGLQESTDW